MFGGLISEAPVRPVPTCCYLPPQRVLPAVFMVQLGGGLARPVPVGRATGAGTALGAFLGLGSSCCRVSHLLSWLVFFALKSTLHARLLPRLRSLLCSSRPRRSVFSLTEGGSSRAPRDAAPLPPCPGRPMESPRIALSAGLVPPGIPERLKN